MRKKPKYDVNPFKFYAIIRSYLCRKHEITLSQLDVLLMMYDESIVAHKVLYNHIPRHLNLYKRMLRLRHAGLVNKIGKLDYDISTKGVKIVDEFYDYILNASNMDYNDIEEESSSTYAIIRTLQHMNKELLRPQAEKMMKMWNNTKGNRLQKDNS